MENRVKVYLKAEVVWVNNQKGIVILFAVLLRSTPLSTLPSQWNFCLLRWQLRSLPLRENRLPPGARDELWLVYFSLSNLCLLCLGWPCDRFWPVRYQWKFLSGASGKTFVFLMNMNNLGGQSLLSFSALLPGMQAQCLEAPQTWITMRWWTKD